MRLEQTGRGDHDTSVTLNDLYSNLSGANLLQGQRNLVDRVTFTQSLKRRKSWSVKSRGRACGKVLRLERAQCGQGHESVEFSD